MTERPPEISASFVDPEERVTPLLVAIGRAVLGVAGLENNLKLEVTRLLVERQMVAGTSMDTALGQRLAKLDEMTAGQLLRELRGVGIPAALDRQISDAIDRRNDLVHRLLEDPDLVKGIQGGEELEVAVERIERLALDSATVGVELQAVAMKRLEEIYGKSQAELVAAVQTIDPETCKDPRERRRLEAMQAMDDLDGPPFPPEQSGTGQRST